MELTSIFRFSLGPAGSGAPPHFHGHAWNALIYGKKRWFLFPPTHAFFSSLTQLEWYNTRYHRHTEIFPLRCAIIFMLYHDNHQKIIPLRCSFIQDRAIANTTIQIRCTIRNAFSYLFVLLLSPKCYNANSLFCQFLWLYPREAELHRELQSVRTNAVLKLDDRIRNS